MNNFFVNFFCRETIDYFIRDITESNGRQYRPRMIHSRRDAANRGRKSRTPSSSTRAFIFDTSVSRHCFTARCSACPGKIVRSRARFATARFVAAKYPI